MNQQRILTTGSVAKPILVSAGQMFGAGKTTMGAYAVEALKMYPAVRKRLSRFNAVKHSVRFGERGLLDAYLDSCFVRIELNLFSPESFPNLSSFLAFVLFSSIMHAAAPSDLESASFQNFLSLNLTDVVEVTIHFFRKFPNQTFFLHWDEIGCIELDRFTHFFGKAHGGLLKLRMKRYYNFWVIITPLLCMEGVYVFATDKRPAFVLIGQGSLSDIVSPTNHQHLVIGGLQPDDIVKTFQKSTTTDGFLLTQFVKIDKSLLSFFGKEVHACTGGLPRLTQVALENLCNLQAAPLLLQNKSDITDALESCYDFVQNSVLLMQRHVDIALQELYLAFMMLAVFKVSIYSCSEVTLTLKADNKISILDSIEAMNVAIDYPQEQGVSSSGISGARKNLIQLRFPSWTLRRGLERGFIDDVRFALLSPLLPMADVLDSGTPFEWILKILLVFSLGRASCSPEQGTWANYFPGFKASSMGSILSKINFNQPMSFVPAVGFLNTTSMEKSIFQEGSASQTTIWEMKMNPKDWKLAFRILVQPYSFVLPGPQSASPDFIYNGATTDSVITAWAIKQNSAGDSISWATIQDEVGKASWLLQVKDVCLVITALHIGKEVEDSIAASGSSSLHLSSGHWSVEVGEIRLNASPDSREQNGVKLTIPHRMDLLILGKQDLSLLLGEDNVHALHELVKKRKCTPSSFLSILQMPTRIGKLHNSRWKGPNGACYR
jgi:hypothetical protein